MRRGKLAAVVDTGRARATLAKRRADVAAMFDGVAARYDLVNDLLTGGLDRGWRRAVVAAVTPEPGQRILDLAAGTGTSSKPFADAGAQVVAADLSLGMLQVGAERQPQLTFVNADALALPFADAAFDAVTCIGSLERFLDRPRAMAEMRRVARPEARFVFLVRNADTLVWRLWRQLLGRREVAGHQDAATLSQWQQRFLAAGFAIETILPDQWPRQRLRRWWRRRRPGQEEPVAGSLLPLRLCNEFVFVLRHGR